MSPAGRAGRGALALVVALALIIAMAGGPGVTLADDHEVRSDEAVSVERGQVGAVSLAVVPETGRRISTDAPLLVDVSVEPAEGVLLPRTRYRREHAADPKADAPRFDLRFRGDVAGAYRLSARVRFWLCGRYTCWPIDVERRARITVQSETPDVDAGPR